jgi:F-type H+-transporting ATPase subunit alpha
VADDLKLAYAQFEELERFSRYGTRLEEGVRRQLERGRRVREVLKQPEMSPIPVAEQIAALLAATEGAYDDIGPAQVAKAEKAVREAFVLKHEELSRRITEGEKLTDSDLDALKQTIAGAMRELKDETKDDVRSADDKPVEATKDKDR